jgi:hypothetical protein
MNQAACEDRHGRQPREPIGLDVVTVAQSPPSPGRGEAGEVGHRGPRCQNPTPSRGDSEQVLKPSRRDDLEPRSQWRCHPHRRVLVERRREPVRGESRRRRPSLDEVKEARAAGSHGAVDAGLDQRRDRFERAVPL